MVNGVVGVRRVCVRGHVPLLSFSVSLHGSDGSDAPWKHDVKHDVKHAVKHDVKRDVKHEKLQLRVAIPSALAFRNDNHSHSFHSFQLRHPSHLIRSRPKLPTLSFKMQQDPEATTLLEALLSIF